MTKIGEIRSDMNAARSEAKGAWWLCQGCEHVATEDDKEPCRSCNDFSAFELRKAGTKAEGTDTLLILWWHVPYLCARLEATKRLLEVFVRKGQYHMQQWPGDKEMAKAIEEARLFLHEVDDGGE